MKKNITTFAVLLTCLFIQFETNFAQSSQPPNSSNPIDLGVLNGKRKTVVEPKYTKEAQAAGKVGVSRVVRVNITYVGYTPAKSKSAKPAAKSTKETKSTKSKK